MDEEDFDWDDKKDPELEDEDLNENENVLQDEDVSEKLDIATTLYLKLKSYIDFHGLTFLDRPNSISDLLYLF